MLVFLKGSVLTLLDFLGFLITMLVFQMFV